MSEDVKKEYILEYRIKSKMSCQFIDKNIIKYREGLYEGEIGEKMKEGYETMASINLQLSGAVNPQDKGEKYKFDDISEYEKWLCGV